MGIIRTTKSFKCPVCGAIHEGSGDISRTRLRLVGRYAKGLCPDCEADSSSPEFVNPGHFPGDDST